MPASGAGKPFWLRLPRWLYWVVGAVVACSGAFIANALAEQYQDINARAPIWIAGSVFIFAGLYILSLGTKSRLGGDDSESGEKKD